MPSADYAGAVTEAGLQQAIIDLACIQGWMTYHTRDSRGSNPGFPDLVLVHQGPAATSGQGQVVFAELKTTTAKLSLGQQLWQHALVSAGAEHHVWRPDDWNDIVDRLKRRSR